jgi:hypothetical protein
VSLLVGSVLFIAQCQSPTLAPFGGAQVHLERSPSDPLLVRPVGSSAPFARLTGGILVEFKYSVTQSVISRLKEAHDLNYVRDLPAGRFVLFRVRQACASPEVALRILGEPEVTSATVEWFLQN